MQLSSESSRLPEWGRKAAETVGDVLGPNLRGLYLFGSAVTGGLRPSSDLDLLALVATPAEASAYRLLARRLLTISNWCPRERRGQPIELTVLSLTDIVPWRYPPRKQFQFGEWLRPQLEAAKVEQPVEDPDVAIILEAARRGSVALAGPRLTELAESIPTSDLRRAMADMLPQLKLGSLGDERNIILALARIWMTIRSGEIVSKDEAASRMLKSIDPAHHFTLDLARRAYLGEIDDDWSPLEQAARAFVEYAHDEIRLVLDS